MLSFQSIAPLIPETFGKIYIGYSGGIDSQVLLHLCAIQAHLRSNIVAVYVNHGLQAVADDWAEHCRNQAQALGVEFRCLKVDAKAEVGESPEAAARSARYQALQPLLKDGDLLLLAQHREDQMETVLLQLFRGAGLQGLAAMPVATRFGLGTMLRPLLNVAKADIQAYAQRHGLRWVEDPSNLSHDFDRNFLRNAIVPLLKQRWPSLDKTVARSARHCGEAWGLLDDWGKQRLSDLLNPSNNSLLIDKLQGLNEAQINWLLRQWLQTFGLKPPSLALLQTIKQQLIAARGDGNSQISMQGYVLRKYRQQLFCLPPNLLVKPTLPCDWPPEQSSLSLANGYILTRIPSASGIDQKLWHNSSISVKPRCGGEKLKLPGRDGQHCLKKLYQERGIPPWERESRPLLYLDERLAAVPGLWIAEWACNRASNDGYSLTWQLPESM